MFDFDDDVMDNLDSAPPEEQKSESTVPAGIPRCLLPACDTSPVFKPCPVLPPVVKYISLKKIQEATEKRCKGDLYGLPFPQTPEEMLYDPNFGLQWLTKAFQTAGSLPPDNAVTKLVSYRRFEGGGSGPKCLFEVEYEKPDDSLDTTLFTKHPYPMWENQQQRWQEEGQFKFGDNWGGEISFYRFLAPHVPFPCPKLYFGDLSRESTEAILINACVAWPEDGKTEFGPYEVLPSVKKCSDFTLTNPQDYYFAIMRRLGTFTGLSKANKLGPEVEKINWWNCTSKPGVDVNASPGMPGSAAGIKSFIEVVAPHWFEAHPKAKTKKFLDTFVKNFDKIYDNNKKVVEWMYADPMYVGLFHQNGNTDNCYFYKRDDGSIDAGILDWGSTSSMAFGSGFIGCTLSALPEMLAEYDEQMVRAWCDAYHETGAPKIDYEELLFRYRISTCISAYGVYSANTMGFQNPQTVQAQKEVYQWFSAWNCDQIRSNFGLQFSNGMLWNRIILFVLKGDVYWDAFWKALKR